MKLDEATLGLEVLEYTKKHKRQEERQKRVDAAEKRKQEFEAEIQVLKDQRARDEEEIKMLEAYAKSVEQIQEDAKFAKQWSHRCPRSHRFFAS